MAVKGAAVMVLISIPVAGVIAYYLGGAGVVSFGYGALVGLLTFASIGVAVSLMLGKTTPLKALLGAGIYVGRILFAVTAVSVAISSGWFPVLPMLGGLVMVYVVESVVLLVEAQRFMSRSSFPDRSGEENEEIDAEDVVSEAPVIDAGRAERRIS